ncbi:MAG TPA: glycosyltransferase family 2 protein [Candidatus Wunengus sp. YC63]|uniref:glycosyltransferase family 2 protein n=1 Tax=Candidatus Wunengus sp. YC63 TaxID=3367699 RepID=UPI00271230B9|nr:glycosyltransferase family 2 protein [Candidatus Brocadiales bacterium]
MSPDGKTVYRVSVLISTKNRFQDLKECIDSILAQTVKPDEIILVDASDTCESLEMVKKALAATGIKLTYHRQDVVAGKIRKTAAWNKAVRLALGDVIIFLDDDVVLDKYYIYHILQPYYENPENIAGVTGYMKKPNDEKTAQKRDSFLCFLNRLFCSLFLLPHEEGNGRMQSSGFPAYPDSKVGIVSVEVMPTCNMSIKKEVFREFTFDEWFYGYSYQEDDDFTYRVSKKYKFLYTPFAELVHKRSPAARGNLDAVETMKIVNHYYFFKKNMSKSCKNCMAFVWAEFGVLFLRCFSFSSIKDLLQSFTGLTAWRNIPLIKARMSGYYKILQSLILKQEIEN